MSYIYSPQGSPIRTSSVGAIRYNPPIVGYRCTISGLGNQDPSTVTFDREEGFPTTFEEVTDSYGNVFVKFPKFYRKVNTVVDGQITSFTISTAKFSSEYELYPCFKKYNGLVETGQEADYVLIGKYCSSSTNATSTGGTAGRQTLANGRSNAYTLGAGYQLYDWKLHKLFMDVALAVSQRIKIKPGSGYLDSYLGFENLRYNIALDGLVHHSDGTYGIAYDPSKYVSYALPTTAGYTYAGYRHVNNNSFGTLKKLGYSATHPFCNYPAEWASESETIYYCNRYYGRSESSPLHICIGGYDSIDGLFLFSTGIIGWDTATHTYVRLCYIP